MKSPEGYLNIMAVLQKWIDQSISVNTSYNPKFYPEEKIPMSEMLKHIINFYKYGGKCLYYFNTYDGAGEVEPTHPYQDFGDVSPPVGVSELDDCDACKI
jgi:ribonucleoside-diphosphate reductase alpha chain